MQQQDERKGSEENKEKKRRYVVDKRKIARRDYDVFQVQKEQEVIAGPLGDDKGNLVTEEADIAKTLIFLPQCSQRKMREACQNFFSCREEGEILKDAEDQDSADNQEIRTKQH